MISEGTLMLNSFYWEQTGILP